MTIETEDQVEKSVNDGTPTFCNMYSPQKSKKNGFDRKSVGSQFRTPISPLKSPRRIRPGSFTDYEKLDDLIILKIYKASELVKL